jgi:hypothetical protein
MPPKMVINPPKSAKGATILANLRVGSIITATEIIKAQKGQMSNNKPRETVISSTGPVADQYSTN